MIRPTLGILRACLDDAHATDDDYVIFGSTVLFLHGIRAGESVADVDVFVKQHVYDAWSNHRFWIQRTPHATDPSFLEWASSKPPIHAFVSWTPRDTWISASAVFSSAITFEGWRVAALEEIRRQKVGAHGANPASKLHEKHDRDIRLIDKYLG